MTGKVEEMDDPNQDRRVVGFIVAIEGEHYPLGIANAISLLRDVAVVSYVYESDAAAGFIAEAMARRDAASLPASDKQE